MNDFPAPETLSTLALARETYTRLLAAYHERSGQIISLEADLAAANELIDENAAALTQAQNDLKTKANELEQAQRDLGAAKQTITANETRLNELQSRISGLESQAQSAESRAAEICASVGVDPLQIKPEPESKTQDVREQFQAIQDPGQRTAFFRKHKEQLLSHR